MRPKKTRFINFNPQTTYFKPRGIPMSSLEENILTVDELEALRLKNYKKLEQVKCAKKMKISQSTFQRILCLANQKIADALINGKAIKIEGGVIKMNGEEKRKFKCEKCKYEWNANQKKSTELIKMDTDLADSHGDLKGRIRFYLQIQRLG